MILEAINRVVEEVLSSDEFKRLLERHLLNYLQSINHSSLNLEPTKAETIIEIPDDYNRTPEGLAWHFRQKLARRPNSGESLEDCTGWMADLIKGGISAATILKTLKERGRSTEPIWDFVKRFSSAQNTSSIKAAADAARARYAETVAKIAARR